MKLVERFKLIFHADVSVLRIPILAAREMPTERENAYRGLDDRRYDELHSQKQAAIRKGILDDLNGFVRFFLPFSTFSFLYSLCC